MPQVSGWTTSLVSEATSVSAMVVSATSVSAVSVSGVVFVSVFETGSALQPSAERHKTKERRRSMTASWVTEVGTPITASRSTRTP
jgi:hypothetical protein